MEYSKISIYFHIGSNLLINIFGVKSKVILAVAVLDESILTSSSTYVMRHKN